MSNTEEGMCVPVSGRAAVRKAGLFTAALKSFAMSAAFGASQMRPRLTVATVLTQIDRAR